MRLFFALLLLAAAALTVPVMAQIKFSNQIPISTRGDGMVALVLADVSGDGKDDLICSSMHDQEIQWYENLGGGSWGERQLVGSSVDGPRSIKAADVDGDGDIDVVYGNSWNGRLAWFENTGSGVFSSALHLLATLSTAKHVSVGDVNNDGKVDVLACDTSTEKVMLFLNSGGGNFSAGVALATYAGDLMTTHLADLDGDSKLDIVVCVDSPNEISWFKGNGDGTFGASQSITTQVAKPELVVSGDFDGDGDIDLASASNGDSKIAWYANNGSGSFGSQQVITTAATSTTWLKAADMDGDGDLDIIACGEGAGNNVVWVENTGSGTFGNVQNISSTLTSCDGIEAGDVDGDGDTDVLAVSWNLDRVAWFENLGGPAKDTGPESVLSNIQSSVQEMCAADLNNDGVKDVAFCNFSGGQVTWLKGLGNGEFDDETAIGALVAPRGIQAADIDADGDMDILVTHQGGLALFRNTGGGSFAAAVHPGTGGLLGQVILCDVDLDGDLDVVVANIASQYEVFWLQNVGFGTSVSSFANLTSIASTPVNLNYSFRIAVGHMNGDLLPDIVTVSGDNNTINVYTNGSNGQSWTAQTAATATPSTLSPTDIALMDIDRDGDKDILLAFKSKLSWIANQNNSQSFGPIQDITTAVSDVMAVTLSDLDGDGDEDVVVGSNVLKVGSLIPTNNAVEWFENTGPSSFATAKVIAKWPIEVSAISTSDLDGDLDEDIMIAASASGKVAWFENRGIAQHLGGSGADLLLRVSVAGGPLVAWPSIHPVSGGQAVLVDFRSPNHTYDNVAPILAVQGYPTTSTLVQNALFPELSLSTFSAAQFPIVVIYDGGSWGVTGMQGTLPPNGLQFSLSVPLGLAGVNVRMQGISLAPNANNPIFTVTEGHELRL